MDATPTSSLIETNSIPAWFGDFTFLFHNDILQIEIIKCSKIYRLNINCSDCFRIAIQIILVMVRKYIHIEQFNHITTNLSAIGNDLQELFQRITNKVIHCKEHHTNFHAGGICVDCTFFIINCFKNFIDKIIPGEFSPPCGFVKTVQFIIHFIISKLNKCNRNCLPWWVDSNENISTLLIF